MFTTSVIITTHNRPVLLRDAVESALNTAPADSEIIVVDDDSETETSDVLASFGERIKVLRQSPRGGRVRARNYGIHTSQGKAVVFLDDDDQFLPGGISSLSHSLLNAPDSVVMTYGRPIYVSRDALGRESIVDKGLPGLGLSGDIALQLLNQNFIQLGALICRRESLVKLGGFSGDMEPIALEDWRLWVRMALIGEIRFVDAEIAKILRHPGNTPEHLFTAAKCEYFSSAEFSEVLAQLRKELDREQLQQVGRLLLRFARSSQNLEKFSTARKLYHLARVCGVGCSPFGPEQLWRSWIPRPWKGRLR